MKKRILWICCVLVSFGAISIPAFGFSLDECLENEEEIIFDRLMTDAFCYSKATISLDEDIRKMYDGLSKDKAELKENLVQISLDFKIYRDNLCRVYGYTLTNGEGTLSDLSEATCRYGETLRYKDYVEETIERALNRL